MNPVDGELVQRHRRGVGLLAEVLDRAEGEGLPAVTWWSIGPEAGTTVLTGYIVHGSRARRQAAFEAWRAALELDHSWENRHGGVVRLYAQRTDQAEMPVLLSVELVSDEEAGR